MSDCQTQKSWNFRKQWVWAFLYALLSSHRQTTVHQLFHRILANVVVCFQLFESTDFVQDLSQHDTFVETSEQVISGWQAESVSSEILQKECIKAGAAKRSVSSLPPSPRIESTYDCFRSGIALLYPHEGDGGTGCAEILRLQRLRRHHLRSRGCRRVRSWRRSDETEQFAILPLGRRCPRCHWQLDRRSNCACRMQHRRLETIRIQDIFFDLTWSCFCFFRLDCHCRRSTIEVKDSRNASLRSGIELCLSLLSTASGNAAKGSPKETGTRPEAPFYQWEKHGLGTFAKGFRRRFKSLWDRPRQESWRRVSDSNCPWSQWWSSSLCSDTKGKTVVWYTWIFEWFHGFFAVVRSIQIERRRCGF